MCIAIPARICSISGTNAEIEHYGIKKTIDITLLPDAKKGDYIIVHAGFAIQIIDESEALLTIKDLKDNV
jgi:hydrogenase expression/formation protein HypC